MKEKVFYDSSIFHYCSGEIGYRWAVKVTYMIAYKLVYGVTDAICLSEMMEPHFLKDDLGTAETLFNSVSELIDEIVPVTEEDFKLSQKLYQKFPDVSPRVLLRAAVMKNNGHTKLCATFATGIERITDIERVNLMEKIDELRQISS